MFGENVDVLDTSARLLRLLSLLQSRPDWTGAELAGRLGVTGRTVRRDVDRLRALGYPVDAVPGVGGGYRLGIGATMPPLLLDDDEASAVAIALAVTAGGAVAGMEEAALAALAKLDRLLPDRLRARTAAVRSATVRVGSWGSDVDPAVLVLLAQAAAGEERLRLVYRDREDRETERRVDPYRLVSTGRRWYLVAYDVDRADWRTFRVDRVASATATGHRFRLDDPPDAAALVSRATSVSPYRWAAVVRVDAPVEEVARRVPATVALVEAADDATVLTTGSDHLDAIVGHLFGLGLPFEVLEPPELRVRLAEAAEDALARHGRRGMLPT